ncbi:MAG: hypothetical protein AAFU68_16015 [Pseudomonadota bacterium]
MAPPLTDLPARATVCQRLCFRSNSLHADAQLQDYTERYVGEDLSEDARSEVHARMRAHCAMLDAAIAEHGGPWLLGAELTMYDFHLGGRVRWSLIRPRHAPLEPEAIARLPYLSAACLRRRTRHDDRCRRT